MWKIWPALQQECVFNAICKQPRPFSLLHAWGIMCAGRCPGSWAWSGLKCDWVFERSLGCDRRSNAMRWWVCVKVYDRHKYCSSASPCLASQEAEGQDERQFSALHTALGEGCAAYLVPYIWNVFYCFFIWLPFPDVFFISSRKTFIVCVNYPFSNGISGLIRNKFSTLY